MFSFQKYQCFSKLKKSQDRSSFFYYFRFLFKIDDAKIFDKLQEPFILRQLNSQFKILPFIIDQNNLQQFRFYINKCEFNQKLLIEWFNQDAEQQQKWLDQDFQYRNFESRQLPIIYPFIQLFRLYLQQEKPLQLAISEKLSLISDLRHPHLLYPEARQIKRNIYYHHGPTNSGKTFHSIEEISNIISKPSLQNNKMDAIYCAPLRLLAFEVQNNINSKQNAVLCQLITGQEKFYIDDARATSCTIETADLNLNYEIAVIDEIQMISDPERGSAWTSAFLGLKAKQLHLCGDSRALNLIQNLCQFTGDNIFEVRYTRLSKLILGGIINPFKDLQPGDCLVAFNVKQLHELRYMIEKKFGHCAIIYGKLPPNNRKQQAIEFNQWSQNGKVKYLVATNAIGMGLNLNIKRIIFTSVLRKNKGKMIQIQDWEILQIAGRAGRQENRGKVYALNRRDLKILRKAFEVQNQYNIEYEEKMEDKEDIFLDESQEKFDNSTQEQDIENEEQNKVINSFGRELTAYEQQIKKAAIFPSFQSIKNFQLQLENAEGKKSVLSEVFKKFCSITQLQKFYFIKKSDTFFILCDLIEDLGMSLRDQYNWSMAPINGRIQICQVFYRRFAEQFVKQNKVNFLENLDIEQIRNKKVREQLEYLEDMYAVCDLYTWLWGKYENEFIDQKIVKKHQEDIEKRIFELLKH